MTAVAHYRCACGAQKVIRDPHGEAVFPDQVPCGWRGCEGYARRSVGCEDCGRPAGDDALIGMGQPPTWLCLPCFVKAVEALGEKLRTIRKSRLN